MNFQRAKVTVRGAVQGVGFRPFVYRLATELRLNGWVSNSASGVFIEVEGARDMLADFLRRLETEKPPRAVIASLESTWLDARGCEGFEIRESDEHGAKTTLILPDIATCADCLREIFDPTNRRFCYPFTNCTNCGPRFTIIESLPYDRPNTSMKNFTMCADCAREYRDPRDRRFHAQPNACPRCGPQLELWDASGVVLAQRDDALNAAAEVVQRGGILALKGVGGFHLIVAARNESAVARLRERKRRGEKPFALMYPTLESLREDCRISELEERLLLSPEAPIVLLQRESNVMCLAPSVAPGNPSLGVMLPSTPLHHLLLAELGFPIVATSGNLSDEPICTDEREALNRLVGIADFFLVHDRPIVRHTDDSVVRVMCGRELVLRRARGYAPLPVRLQTPLPLTVLGVGAHLKNSVALSVRESADVFISQHIGDLETGPAFAAFQQVAADLPRLYDLTPDVIACDLHPDYLSTQFARGKGSAGILSAASGILPDDRLAVVAEGSRQDAANGGQDARASLVFPVQHHWAHVLACMAENELDAPVLGVSWDGTGYGLDGTIWGGEFLLADPGNDAGFQRVAHLRPFRLPGGSAAVREPRRSALGVLFELGDEAALRDQTLAPVRSFSDGERTLLRQMLAKGFNAPVTSSAGRLFDAVAALIGLRQRSSSEGQAAMELEFAAEPRIDAVYPFEITDDAPHGVDWRPAIEAIIDEVRRGERAGIMAAKFHGTLAEMIVAVARKIGEPKVVLTGGCFQNRLLTEACVSRLRDAGFRPYWHQRVPPNDGGIALGQVMAANLAQRRTSTRRKGAAAA